MPVIHTHVSVETTAEQREALKSAFGQAITAIPGKSEAWLMCPFEDNMPIHMAVERGATDIVAVYLRAVGVFNKEKEKNGGNF